jgi:hypothetical protein
MGRAVAIAMMSGVLSVACASRVAPAPAPVPALPAQPSCDTEHRAAANAIAAASGCTADADCEVRRVNLCGEDFTDCTSIHVNKQAAQAPIDAALDAWRQCTGMERMCRCAEPAASVCRQGKCTHP